MGEPDVGARAREALHEEALSKAEFDLLGYPDPISADLCDRIVRVYLKHMAGAGFKLVPMAVTPEMVKRGRKAGAALPVDIERFSAMLCWQAMHDAAPATPFGDLGIKVIVDPKMPPGEMEIRSGKNRVRIVNLDGADTTPPLPPEGGR